MEKNLREIAKITGGEVIGDGNTVITGINSLDKAAGGEISLFFDSRYKDKVKDTKASALLVHEKIDIFQGPQVVVSDPRLAYAALAGIFAPPLHRFQGISRDAIIDETCSIGKDVSIYPMVYIGKNSVIGDNVTLFPGTFLGEDVRVGDRTVIYPNVTILHGTIIGRDVILHAGCVIGSDGFGFVREGAENVKVPQLGIVQIDDKVELGANTTVDRGAFGKTWIKRGVKTDNLVQIAHGVEVGEDTILVALTGVSGSTRIGREVVIGGQVGIGDHLTIGDRVMIGSRSGVFQSVSSGEVVSGSPSMPHRAWLKATRLIARLPKLNDRLRNLEKKVKALEDR